MRAVDKILAGTEARGFADDRCACVVCGVRSTREKKPWCSECLMDHSAVAAAVRVEVEAREVEAATCRPRLDGTLVPDVLGVIAREGATNPALMARHVRLLQGGRARPYMDRLVSMGLLDRIRTRPKSRSRQTVAYALTDKGRGALA